MDRSVGIVIVAIGAAIAVVGLLALSGALSWFGRLPGDVRIHNEHSRVYIPIVSSLLISVVLSVLLSLARRFF
jgi:H+/Cl- antiporter ClcA